MNYFNPEDTICAITTGGGMSAIAVIRISGIKASRTYKKVRL